MTGWKGWKAIVRDVIIIWIITGIGGFVIGIATAGSRLPILAIAVSNILLGIVGFCISGCMIKDNRWKHLTIVALLVWLTSIVNTIFGPFSLSNWFFGIALLFVMMAIGGGLSFIFVKPVHNDPQSS